MQILQTAGGTAGARGWLWRIEAVESAGRRRAALLHLTRESRAGTARLTAVRRIEPIARVAAPGRALVAMPCADAATIVAHAAREARGAFTVPAAERLNGDVHAWQLAAALAFTRGYSRVLGADPPGAGKTVSAAIAIGQCLDADPGARCLVLCPGHLLAQWRDELRRRMAIEALIIDAPCLRQLLCTIPAGVSPWTLSGCRIVSLDFVKQPHVARSLEAEVLDLLVIDEAHLACGVSDRHAVCDMLARRARRVLLLTATPSDGGAERVRALTSLGASGDAIVTLRHPPATGFRRAVARTLCLPAHRAVAALHDALDEYARWIAQGPRHGAPEVALLASLLVKRALSSAHAARISLERRLALAGDTPSMAQPGLFDSDDDDGLIGVASGRPASAERARLSALVDLAAAAERRDDRLVHLERLLRRTTEPVVIFSCFRDTAEHLANRLSRWCDTRLVHGQLPQASIDAALSAFVDGPARVLVATDVASQGLNLHAR
jgi:superfamily II DNA or RNA helicase